MDWLSILLIFLPSAVLFGIGYLVRYRKAYWMISGYNTMPAEKKKKVDVEGLGKLMGNMCFILGAIFLIGISLLYLKQPVAGFAFLGLTVPVIIYTLIAAQKFDGNTRKESGEMKTSAKFTIGGLVVFLLLLLGFVGFMVYQGFQPASITFENDVLTIAGSYGRSIPRAEINNVELSEVLPEVQRRTNGSAIGDRLRGHFQLKDIGPALLFLDRGKPPFIRIETGSDTIFLNLETAEQTRKLFTSLSP